MRFLQGFAAGVAVTYLWQTYGSTTQTNSEKQANDINKYGIKNSICSEDKLNTILEEYMPLADQMKTIYNSTLPTVWAGIDPENNLDLHIDVSNLAKLQELYAESEEVTDRFLMETARLALMTLASKHPELFEQYTPSLTSGLCNYDFSDEIVRLAMKVVALPSLKEAVSEFKQKLEQSKNDSTGNTQVFVRFVQHIIKLLTAIDQNPDALQNFDTPKSRIEL